MSIQQRPAFFWWVETNAWQRQLFAFFFTSAPVHRCRNRGGHDVSSCSSDSLPAGQRDLVCGSSHAHFRYCHISAFNDASQDVRYSFTNYPYFTADSAHATCSEIGGKVPSITNQHRQFQLEFVIEYLSGFVRYNRPYTLKYANWPVKILIIKFENFPCFKFLRIYYDPIYHN